MTAFGVFWGLLMLILLLGFGASITGGLLDSIKSVPSNSIFVMGSRTTISYKGFGRDRRISVDNIDMQLVKNEMPDKIRFITPINFAGTKNANVGEFNYDASVVGTTPSYYHVLPTQMIYGRYLNEVDQRERRKVCVIGRQTYETLFPGGGDPCGQMVQVGSISYTIVGVAKKLSELVSIGTDLDRSLLLPINTEQLMYNEGSQIDLTERQVSGQRMAGADTQHHEGSPLCASRRQECLLYHQSCRSGHSILVALPRLGHSALDCRMWLAARRTDWYLEYYAGDRQGTYTGDWHSQGIGCQTTNHRAPDIGRKPGVDGIGRPDRSDDRRLAATFGWKDHRGESLGGLSFGQSPD